MAISEPTSAATILILGQDKSLVETRKWVLEQAGYRLQALMPPTVLPELPVVIAETAADLVLLCDSLSSETREAILRVAPERWPSVPLIVITPGPFHLEPEPPAIIFPSHDGPGKLVALIQQLLPLHLPGTSPQTHPPR